MTEMTLLRVSYTNTGTFGVLLQDKVPFALTLENPWVGNQPFISCIPTGVYRCLRCRKSPDYGFKDSPKFGDTFQVFNVPGRSTILFHKGNLTDDTKGCVLVGEMFEHINGRPGIAASAQGYAEFMRRLKDVDEFTLTLKAAG